MQFGWFANIKKIKRQKDLKILARYDKDTEKNVRTWQKEIKNVRKFDNSGAVISIEDREEVLISLIKSNVTLLIRDKAFADVMARLFLAAYEKAEAI